jgi:hypothetical protein
VPIETLKARVVKVADGAATEAPKAETGAAAELFSGSSNLTVKQDPGLYSRGLCLSAGGFMHVAAGASGAGRWFYSPNYRALFVYVAGKPFNANL